MSSLLRDVVLDLAGIARHPRRWGRSLHMMECPVCGEEISIRHKDRMAASRAAHRKQHGTPEWREALAYLREDR